VNEFATLLADGRARLDIDQAEFGSRVGVGQQAVSRWEQGRSRPRRAVAVAVARVLELPVDEVLAAAGYVGAVADSPTEISPSVRPLAPTLPFDQLTPERFEAACAAILQHLHPDGHASRYGGSGEHQEGIDVLFDGEMRAIGQCKRRKQFGASDVKTAVRAVANPAPKNYLFLSRRTATAAARAEMARHDAWELWDGEDLSRYVSAEMSKDDAAVRFVDAYFPNHREPFLGVPQPGPWLTIAEFYAPVSGNKPYTHDWNLAGRQTELAELQFALESTDYRVAIVLGRGGTGKTRLLRSIAEIFEAKLWLVRLLSTGSEPDPASFERLPASGPALLIIDDAHDRTDIGNIVARVHSRNREARVLIASRPYGERNLDHALRRAGLFLSDPGLPTVTLKDLTQDEAVTLAREALGPAHSQFADRLGMLTPDSPLVITVGGYLLRTGALDPRKLEQDERMRHQILIGFRDALIAESGDGEQRLAVIHALSALQPFRTGNSEFRSAIAELVGIPYNRIRHHLRSLEDSGVLIRRGDSLRLIPDLLGDVVLADATYDKESGIDSGYLSELIVAANGGPLANVFVNLSRVDWQVGHALAKLTAPLWDMIQRDLERREIGTHIQVLGLLSRVAPFQPERVIKAVRWILANPLDESSLASDTPPLLQWTWAHVVDEIPAILRAASYTLECFREACSVLWELAQTDRRSTHHYPNHPLRVLSELAEFAPQKPPAYNEAILSLAESWAEQEPELSPLRVIEGLVATEGSSQKYSTSTHTLSIHPFGLRQDVVLPIRRRAIELALSEIQSGDYRRGVAGAQFATLALRYPTSSFSHEGGDEERKSWEPDFLETIEALKEILRSAQLDPVVCVAIFETLHFHRSGYGSGRTTDAAEAAIAALPKSVAFQFALLVHDGWGALVREDGTDFEQHARVVSARLSQASSRALSELDDATLVLLLEERLHREEMAFGADVIRGVELLGALVEQRPSIIEAIVNRLFEHSDSALRRLIPNLVSLLGHYRDDELMDTVHRLSQHAAPGIRVEAAVGLAGRDRSVRVLHAGELELLKQFASSPEVRVRLAVVDAARALATTDIREASELVAQIRFNDSRDVARRIFMYLDRDMSDLAWAALTEGQQSTLLAELTKVPDVNDPWIVEFLCGLGAADPRRVLGLLRHRIELAESMENLRDFHPLPYHWSTPLVPRQHPDFLPVLRELLFWLGEDNSWKRAHFGRDLFAAAVGSFDEPVLSLLLESLQLGTEAEARTVSKVLEGAPNDFVYKYVSFISEALDSAARFGPNTLKAMHSSLFASATTGMRHGAPGEPFPEDVRLRDEGAAIADTLPPTTAAAAQFYRDLSLYGTQAVDREIERDSTDHRAWW
jgi:transcriptional regulator with XRE-family HTH domain